MLKYQNSAQKLLKKVKSFAKARSKRRFTHVPNLTDELGAAEERRLNKFGSAG